MHSVELKTQIHTEAMLDGKPADSVLREVCDACHEGIESASVLHQDSENNPTLNTAKNWRNECETLEGILCRILDLLGD